MLKKTFSPQGLYKQFQRETFDQFSIIFLKPLR